MVKSGMATGERKLPVGGVGGVGGGISLTLRKFWKQHYF